MKLSYIYNDGGRSKYHSTDRASSDCVLRSLCIFFKVDYEGMYQIMRDIIGRDKYKYYRCVPDSCVLKLMTALGFEFVEFDSPKLLDSSNIPMDRRIIVDSQFHFSAVINGVVNDTFDPQLDKDTQWIIGYYIHKKIK